MADPQDPAITLDPEDFTGDETDVNDKPAAPQEPATPDPSPDDKNPPEAAKTPPTEEELAPAAKPEGDKPTDGEEEEPPKPADKPAEEEKPAEDKPRGADERKAQLNAEIRDLVGKRNAIKQEVERLNAGSYQPQTPEQLMAEGMSETDARVAAMEQKVELNDYNNKVAEAQLTISNESERVLRDFPMFDPASPQYIEPVAKQASDLLRQNLIFDPNNEQVIGAHVSPYSLYKTIYDANQASAVENQIAGQRAAESMAASAEPPSSAVPKEKREDPFLAGLLGK